MSIHLAEVLLVPQDVGALKSWVLLTAGFVKNYYSLMCASEVGAAAFEGYRSCETGHIAYVRPAT